MSYNNDEVRGVLIQSGNERLLLPNATIAEVMSRVKIEPLPDVPAWLVGRIGWQVPLVAFADLAGYGHDPVERQSKVVVLKAQSERPELPYVALLTSSFPQLISVPRDGLLADASEETLPRGVHMRVLLGEQSALLPDLETVEAAAAAALAEAGALQPA